MLKVPSKKEFELEEKRRAKIYEILKKDARIKLNEGYLSLPVEKLLRLMLDQDEMVGNIKHWIPSLEALRKIAKFTEDRFVPSGLNELLADEVKGLVLDSYFNEAVKLLEQFTLSRTVETLDKSIARENQLFYCLGDIWLIRFDEGLSEPKKRTWTWMDDTLQLRYIAKLLEIPYRIYSPKDLKDAIDGIYTVRQALPGEGYLTSGQKTHKIKNNADNKTVEKAFKKVYEELERPNASDDAIWKWRMIKQEYSSVLSVWEDHSTGELKFKWRANPESIRANVAQQIKTGIGKIEDCLPDLGRHLDEYIQKGNSPRYIPPETTPKWCIKW